MNRRRAYCAYIAIPPFIFVFGGCGGVTNADNVDRLSSAERSVAKIIILNVYFPLSIFDNFFFNEFDFFVADMIQELMNGH